MTTAVWRRSGSGSSSPSFRMLLLVLCETAKGARTAHPPKQAPQPISGDASHASTVHLQSQFPTEEERRTTNSPTLDRKSIPIIQIYGSRSTARMLQRRRTHTPPPIPGTMPVRPPTTEDRPCALAHVGYTLRQLYDHLIGFENKFREIKNRRREIGGGAKTGNP